MGWSVAGTMRPGLREHDPPSGHEPLPEPLTSSPIQRRSGHEFNGMTCREITSIVGCVFIELTF